MARAEEGADGRARRGPKFSLYQVKRWNGRSFPSLRCRNIGEVGPLQCLVAPHPSWNRHQTNQDTALLTTIGVSSRLVTESAGISPSVEVNTPANNCICVVCVLLGCVLYFNRKRIVSSSYILYIFVIGMPWSQWLFVECGKTDPLFLRRACGCPQAKGQREAHSMKLRNEPAPRRHGKG
jgi:hypothetical protein